MDFDILAWTKTEILFVASVLVTVAAVSFFQVRQGEMKTRDSQRKSDLGLLAKAIGGYLEDHQQLPPASAAGEIVSCGQGAQQPCVWGNSEIVDLQGVSYLKHVPGDPQASLGRVYVYTPDPAAKKYRISTSLEDLGDPGLRPNLTTACGPNIQCNWYVEY